MTQAQAAETFSDKSYRCRYSCSRGCCVADFQCTKAFSFHSRLLPNAVSPVAEAVGHTTVPARAAPQRECVEIHLANRNEMHLSRSDSYALLLLFGPGRVTLTATQVVRPVVFSARQHAERAICYRPSVYPSVCLSVTRVDQSKTVEARIMRFSPYSSLISLVFAG